MPTFIMLNSASLARYVNQVQVVVVGMYVTNYARNFKSACQ